MVTLTCNSFPFPTPTASCQPQAQRVAEGVYWQCDLQAAADNVKRGEAQAGDFKFVLGHASWGPGQLEGEIRNHTWLAVGLADKSVAAEGEGRGRGGGPEAGGADRAEARITYGAEGSRRSYSSLVFCCGLSA